MLITHAIKETNNNVLGFKFVTNLLNTFMKLKLIVSSNISIVIIVHPSCDIKKHKLK